MKYIDITLTIFAGMKKYPSDPDVEVSSFKSLGKGNSCNLNRLVSYFSAVNTPFLY